MNLIPEMKLYHLIKHIKRTVTWFLKKTFLSGICNTTWATSEKLFQLSYAILFSNGKLGHPYYKGKKRKKKFKENEAFFSGYAFGFWPSISSESSPSGRPGLPLKQELILQITPAGYEEQPV